LDATTTATLLEPVLSSIFPETTARGQADSKTSVAANGLSSSPLPDAFDVIKEELGNGGYMNPHDVIMKEQLKGEKGGSFSLPYMSSMDRSYSLGLQGKIPNSLTAIFAGARTNCFGVIHKLPTTTINAEVRDY